MKRTLILIRHAATRQAGFMQEDFDRRLTVQGEQEAVNMASKLKQLNLLPDLIIASTATRAQQTVQRFAEVMDYHPDNIQWEDDLYHCDQRIFESIITKIADEKKTVFIVAHNPGITEFANELSPFFRIDNLPTCGMIGTQFVDEPWNTFRSTKKEVFLSDYPKKTL